MWCYIFVSLYKLDNITIWQVYNLRIYIYAKIVLRQGTRQFVFREWTVTKWGAFWGNIEEEISHKRPEFR